MAIPDGSEQAARRIERIGNRMDALIVGHVVNGDRLPTPASFLRTIREHVEQAVTLALLDIDPDVSQTTVDAAVEAALDEQAVLYRRAVRDAQTRRRRIVRARPLPDDEDTNPSGIVRLVRRYGFPAALAAIVSTRRRLPRERLRQAAAAAGEPIPPRLAAILKASIRTKATELRNLHTADLVEARGTGWAVWVRDGFKGTDEPCLSVDRRWATAEWLRRHPYEHPNCTREGRPRELPVGARITLLR